jgi:dihydrofolate reductase
VAGGQEIFAEALRHSSAYEVHLTMVDTTIDIHPTQDGTKPEVAFFPPKYRWDRFYDKISEQPGTDTTTPCTYVVYRRKSTMT